MVNNLPAKAGDTRDTGLILRLRRFPRVKKGNSLQYSAWRIPWTEELGRRATVHGVAEWDMTEHARIYLTINDAGVKPVLHGKTITALGHRTGKVKMWNLNLN